MNEKTHTKTSIRFFERIGIGSDRDYFIENLSMLVSSGMSIISAFDAIGAEVRSKNMRTILSWMKQEIEAGSPLWRALEKTGIFPAHTISLVRVGEESGKLVDTLKVIGAQQEKEREFRSKIRSAMLYPIFVLSVTLVIGIGIAWFILPKLAAVFSQLRLKLPLITKMLIATGTFLGTYGAIAVPVFVLLVAIFIYFIFFFPKTKFLGQSMLFSFPGLKTFIQEVELARLGHLLGTLLNAGLPITLALDSLEKAATFPHYKALYIHLKKQVDEGNSFQKGFASYRNIKKLIPTPIQQLIVAGEQSGHLPDILLKIGQNFEAKTENSTKSLTVILEPILLVIVWMGVVAVALAVIMPIYSLIGGLSEQISPSPTLPENIQSTQPEVPAPTVTQPPTTETTTQQVDDRQNTAHKLQILPTELNYLNVRTTPSSKGEIMSTVTPGDTLEYTHEEGGWYEVVLPNGDLGWVSGRYTTILENETGE